MDTKTLQSQSALVAELLELLLTQEPQQVLREIYGTINEVLPPKDELELALRLNFCMSNIPLTQAFQAISLLTWGGFKMAEEVMGRADAVKMLDMFQGVLNQIRRELH